MRRTRGGESGERTFFPGRERGDPSASEARRPSSWQGRFSHRQSETRRRVGMGQFRFPVDGGYSPNQLSSRQSPQERPGAVETRPEVGGGDLEQFASLLGAQAIDFPEERNASARLRGSRDRRGGRKRPRIHAGFEDRTRVASPGVRHGTPVSVGIETRGRQSVVTLDS